MKALDRFLQSWRITKSKPYISRGARVLDIGCSDGVLFRQLDGLIGEGIGIDPGLEEPVEMGHYHLVPGTSPPDLRDRLAFDVITMLAVLEHVPPEHQQGLARACSRYLTPGGHLVITAPSPLVDHILHALVFFRLIDGMALHQHFGFQPRDTPGIFQNHELTLVVARKFQLGLNNLFVFRKDA